LRHNRFQRVRKAFEPVFAEVDSGHSDDDVLKLFYISHRRWG
jgi:hypothetical protein